MRIPANRNPFSQGEVNFAETMFYDKLEPDDENPTPSTLGALILEEEEEGGRGTRDLETFWKGKSKRGSSAPQDPKNVWWCENLGEG